MYQNVKRTCRVSFWLINPIVLWRSRCRRRRRCLSSLANEQRRRGHAMTDVFGHRKCLQTEVSSALTGLPETRSFKGLSHKSVYFCDTD